VPLYQTQGDIYAIKNMIGILAGNSPAKMAMAARAWLSQLPTIGHETDFAFTAATTKETAQNIGVLEICFVVFYVVFCRVGKDIA
jgi:hypothetical protein